MERNLDLSHRREDTREKLTCAVLEFELEEIKNHFSENITLIKEQISLVENLITKKEERCAEELLRSQIVFLESALDFYMHEITQFGAKKMYEGIWLKTERYQNLQISMQQLEHILGAPEEEWFLSYINEVFSSDTFMSYDELKKQLNFLGIKITDVANAIFYDISDRTPTKDKMKESLNKIYFRRNCIVHQSDRDRKTATRNPIMDADVSAMVDTVEKIVNKIHALAKNKG